jgi:hypothetical protein
MITFAEYRQSIFRFCHNSIKEFKNEKPDFTIATIGIYCDPFLGEILINFDSPTNSENFVKEFLDQGPGWYGEDQHGKYNNHCPDFEYFGYKKMEIPEWEDEFEISDQIVIKHNLKKMEIDLSQVNNEVVYKAFYDFLNTIVQDLINELSSDEDFKDLNIAPPLRVGLQIADSEFYNKYWPVQLKQENQLAK